MAQFKKSSALCHTHFLSLVAERWVPGFREQLTHWTDPAVFTQPDQWKGFLSAMVTGQEADFLYMRKEQVQSRRTDAERSQTGHFREQREEQVVLPSVVRRVPIVHGSKVYNEGQRKLDVCTLDGQQRRSMTFQVARVKKALGSVSQMVKNGNKLVFDQDSSGKDTSYIQNKRTNEKIWLRQEKRCVRLGPDGGTPAKEH